MEGSEFFDGGKASLKKKIGKLEEVREETKEPAHPNAPVKRTSDLKKEIDNKNGKGKVGEKFLQEGGFFTFCLLC